MVKLIVLMGLLALIPWMENSLSVSVHLALLVMEESVEQTAQLMSAHRLLIVLKLPPVSTHLMMGLSVFAPVDTKGMVELVAATALVHHNSSSILIIMLADFIPEFGACVCVFGGGGVKGDTQSIWME